MKISVVVALILLAFTVLKAQDLSTLVLPSEDELIEALNQGEIDYSEFLILIDIIEHSPWQFDSTLIDQIPNLSYFLRYRTDKLSSLSIDQEMILQPNSEFPSKRPRVLFHHRYYRRAEENSASKYRSKITVNLNEKISFYFNAQREENGTERLTGRGFKYKSRSGRIKELIVGSFSKRFGLGTLLGYRGKLFDFSGELGGESVLYPDFGGYNGLYLKAQSGNQMIQLLGSVNRDENYRMMTTGGRFSLAGRSLSPSLTLAALRVINRSTDSSFTDFKIALGTRYKYSTGYIETEIAAQSNEISSDMAIVIEGSHNFDPSALNYAAWFYGEDYFDLTSGSKTAEIYRSSDYASIDFSATSKRSGQKGILVKTISFLSSNTKFENSILLAGYNIDSVNIQYLPAVEIKLGQNSSIRLDYLNRTKRRLFSNSIDKLVKQRWRVESRIRSGKFRVRSYIAYTDDESGAHYLSLFNHLRGSSERSGLVELWLNLGRVSTRAMVLDYWYGFVRSAKTVSNNLEAGVKLMHRFERGVSNEHLTTFMFELKAILI